MRLVLTVFTILVSLAATAPVSAQTWVDITPASGPMPPARWLASAVFDSQERRMVIFGGDTASSARLNDVWAFDLDTHTWTDLTPSMGSAPAVRRTPVSIYDPVAHEMVTWSGQGAGGTFLNDVWSFDLTANTWTQHTPTGGPPAIRYGAAGVRDPLTGDLVTFAGFTFMGRFDDVWRFDNAASTWTDVSAPPASSPLERCLHSASYDAQNHRMIMYGGQNGGALDDIWAFDLALETWSEFTPTTVPAGRWFPAHVYDTANHRSTVFGGSKGGTRTNEVLVFDLNLELWGTLSPSGTPPSAREGSAAVYDGANDRMVVFAGWDGGDNNDVWELTGLSNAITAIDERPQPEVARLGQNHPNPFNPVTTIEFEIVSTTRVSIRVYNLRGQLVRTLVDGTRTPGPHSVIWNGRDEAGRAVSSGVYFYRLTAEGVEESRKMVLVQ
jgi:hypothetical protein